MDPETSPTPTSPRGSALASPLNPWGPVWLARNPHLRRATLALMDGLLMAAGLAVNFELWLHFRHGRVPEEYESLLLHVVGPIVLLRLGLFYAFGLYQSISRHAGNYEMLLIAAADSIATAVIILLNLCTSFISSLGGYPLDSTEEHILRIPWGIVFNDWMLTLIATAGIRLLWREIVLRYFSSLRPEQTKRVLIIGAGDAGEQVARDLSKVTAGAYRPVAYVDPEPSMVGLKIHGIPVAGNLTDLAKIIERFRPDELVIALQRPTPRILSEIVEHCHSARLEFKIVPPLTSVMSGGVVINTLRRVEIEDLLGREPVNLQQDGHPTYLQDKRVLITGGGGSIGRELCRQALAQKPKSVVLIGKGENSIFESIVELGGIAQKQGTELLSFIGDVRDEDFVQDIFQKLRPQIVFHAAAHKHVHLMEAQPAEAVKNNVLGTFTLARAAKQVEVERFIFISTDKAVRPTGIMGASKRVAEMVVSAMNGSKGGGVFLSVRFGNVLGSRGSVIPTFRRQIELGGPLTITDPEVTRYFMTIPEAVSLVIQAGELGKDGELFILDMGKPVRIVDLARNLITLSGLEPQSDIPIVFTGLRPGEKLSEELLTQDEGVSATSHGKIFITQNELRPWNELKVGLEKLFEAAESNDDAGVRNLLKEMIPDNKFGS